jgi:hypothetical protein
MLKSNHINTEFLTWKIKLLGNPVQSNNINTHVQMLLRISVPTCAYDGYLTK